jgi:Tfp pilus assembly protein FimV
MPFTRSSRALALLLALPSAAFALGLGDIHLSSPLNAPLDAQIELVDVAPDEMNTVQAQLASRETFARYGLDWPAYLSGVQVHTVRTGDGRAVIKLTSTEAISDPFVTLLVEVSWARGHLVREYTVLLDPRRARHSSPTHRSMLRRRGQARARATLPAALRARRRLRPHRAPPRAALRASRPPRLHRLLPPHLRPLPPPLRAARAEKRHTSFAGARRFRASRRRHPERAPPPRTRAAGCSRSIRPTHAPSTAT